MSKPVTLTCKAAVCWKPNEKLVIEEIQVDPPRSGEVRIKNIATGIVRNFIKIISSDF